MNMPDDVAGSLELAGYRVISYPNSQENEDLIRVQSLEGIMREMASLMHGAKKSKGA